MAVERVSGHPMIWWGMALAPFVYLGLSLFVIQPAGPALGAGTLAAVLAGIGVLQLGAAQVIWARVKRGTLTTLTTADGNTAPWAVIVWALDEAPAVLGFVLIILGGAREIAFGLMGASVAALLLNAYWTLEGGA